MRFEDKVTKAFAEIDGKALPQARQALSARDMKVNAR
jgi:hypothetical protein